MDWPKALIEELAFRRTIIFLGAGASVACKSEDGSKSPPTWDLLLSKLCNCIADAEEKTFITTLIKEKKYLDAAEIIHCSIPPADFTRIVREEFLAPRYKPSAIHETVLKIDPKIVITTNYDDIYDNYCRLGDAKSSYNICKYYDTHLVSDLRSPIRIIIKAHGCVSDPSKIILTRSQYFQERLNHNNFYKILNALFLTHTILFVGYSISDPDIQLLLENATIAAPSSHPHYAIIPNDLHKSLKTAATKSYNIQFIEFENGNYAQANELLKKLCEDIQSYREKYRI